MEDPTDSAPDEQHINEIFLKQKDFSFQLRTEKLGERKKRLKKLQIWIEKNEKAIHDALYKDLKKPALEASISETYPVLNEIRHALNHLRGWSRSKKVDAPLAMVGTSSFIQYEPKGVCLIISPWNFPFNLAIGPLVSALAAGNTAILKPSELTPNTAEIIAIMVGEIFTEQEVRVFNGDAEISQALLKMPFNHIFFTGSPAVGKIVMKAAAEHLTAITLELGGKSPAIVDESANLKDAAEKIAWGKFLNNGQTCIAPDYVLVHQSVKEAFVEHLKTYIQKLFDNKLKGYQQSDDYARIVNGKHFNRVQELIENGIAKGAKIIYGGKSDTEDNYIPPTLMDKVPAQCKLMEEEIFGPVLPLLDFEDLEEVTEKINAKPKPLALYYFGQSVKNKKYILTHTSSGGVCINDCVIHFNHTNLPFGGVNHSGLGKSHGWYGFRAFSNEKAVLRQKIGFTNTKLLYPPYGYKAKKILNLLKKYF